MKREAYNQGWRDAVAAITRSANTLITPPDVKAGPKPKAGNGTAPNLPAIDSNFGRVLAAVKARPGMTGAETVKAVAQAGHSIQSESVRACLQRLQKRQLVKNIESKWFPVEISDTEETAGPSANP